MRLARGAVMLLFPGKARAIALSGALVCLALTACSASGDATPTEPPPPRVVSETPLACHLDTSIACFASLAEGGPPKDGAIVWESKAGMFTAVYEDGTVQTSPVIRSLYDLGVVSSASYLVGKVGPTLLETIRQDVAALGEDDYRSFDSDADVLIQAPQGRGCFSAAPKETRCESAPIARLYGDLVHLADAANEKWNAAPAGTIMLSTELPFGGLWPLGPAPDDGTLELMKEDADQVKAGSVYDAGDGTFVRVDTSWSLDSQLTDFFVSHVTGVVLDDNMADLRGQLLGNVGHPVEVGSDRFAAFRNRDVAIVPATSTTPAVYYNLSTFGHLDLREDGPIE